MKQNQGQGEQLFTIVKNQSKDRRKQEIQNQINKKGIHEASNTKNAQSVISSDLVPSSSNEETIA